MLNDIIQKQKEFQHKVGTPIDDPMQMNFLSEVFLFKAIEEIIELRKEFPSGLNKKSKVMKEADPVRIYEELSDVLLFLVNFLIVRGLDLEVLLKTIESVQTNNFNQLTKHEKNI